MEAYKPYVDYITAGQVAETAYILSREGAICGTSLPIQAMPHYEFDLVDENDPNITHKVVVDERVNLLEAISNHGVCKNKAGIRLYNQKYYTVRYDQENETIYLKKVFIRLSLGKRRSLYQLDQKLHHHRHFQYRNQDAKRRSPEPRRAEQENRSFGQGYEDQGIMIHQIKSFIHSLIILPWYSHNTA